MSVPARPALSLLAVMEECAAKFCIADKLSRWSRIRALWLRFVSPGEKQASVQNIAAYSRAAGPIAPNHLVNLK